MSVCLPFCRYVTYLPVDGGAASTTLEIGSQAQQAQMQPQSSNGPAQAALHCTLCSGGNSNHEEFAQFANWFLSAAGGSLAMCLAARCSANLS